MWNKIIFGLKSRTFWTIVAMFLVGGTNGIMGVLPSGSIVYVQGLLALMTMYFKFNPSQEYTK